MDLVRSIDVTKLKREKSKISIQLALEGKWNEAISTNLDILRYFEQDVEALNRLAKAYLETGVFNQARETFQKVLRISPHNNIAKKNLDRLSHLPGSSNVALEGKRVTPKLFLEESGKSTVSVLRNPSSQQVLARVAAGDSVRLQMHNSTLVIKGPDDDILGYIEPKLGSRLVKLIGQGNKYDAAVRSIGEDGVSIIFRETFKHPSLLGICSFPASGRGESRSSVRDALLRYNLDSEPEEEIDEDPISMWTEEGEEIVPLSRARRVRSLPDADDED